MLLMPILGAGLSGQILKSLVEAVRRRERSLSRIADFESFPNMHAVLGGSLSYQVGEEVGFSSTIFAVAAMLTLVLLYDTSGVKRAASKQAWVLNRLSEVRAGGKPLLEVPGQSTVRTWAAAIFGICAGIALERAWLAIASGT